MTEFSSQRGDSTGAAQAGDFIHDPSGQNRYSTTDLSVVEKQLQLIEYQQQIAQNDDQQSHSSYLERIVHSVWHPEQRLLKAVKDEVATAKQHLDTSHWTADEAATLAAKYDKYQSSFEGAKTVARLGSELVKGGFLFLGDDIGMVGAAASYALDEMHPADTASSQVIDAALGASKGLAIAGTINALDATGWNPVMQGVGGGVSSRLIDSVLTRSNYVVRDSSFSLRNGLAKSLSTAFNVEDLTTDVITLGSSLAALEGANGITSGAISSHRLPRKISMGAVYGLTVGASGELQRQRQSGEKFDFARVAEASMALGAIDALAAVPGGATARPIVRLER